MLKHFQRNHRIFPAEVFQVEPTDPPNRDAGKHKATLSIVATVVEGESTALPNDPPASKKRRSTKAKAESALPSPLVDAEVDLRNFDYMPLLIEQIQRSRAWLICKRQPEMAFFMLNLWMNSWHEVPAGSLENDDDVLADRAMCPPSRWPKVKLVAFRNWILCSDGRYYHSGLAEVVKKSWTAKLRTEHKTEGARIAKHNQRHKAAVKHLGFEEWLAAGRPTGCPLPVHEDIAGTSRGTTTDTGSNGEEEEGEYNSQVQSQAEGKKAPPPSRGQSGNPTPAASATELLVGTGMTMYEAQALVYELSVEYRDVLLEAVKTAVKKKPGGLESYLRATCRGMQEQGRAISAVAAPAPGMSDYEKTQARLAEEKARDEALKGRDNSGQIAAARATAERLRNGGSE